MAEAVVAFGLQKLWELLFRESHRLKRVHEHVTELQNDLRRLKSFVKDAEETSKSERVKNCVEEIVDIVYDAEDIIERFLINEERFGRKRGIKKHLEKVACITFTHKEFGSQIRSILSRISRVIYNMEKFGVREIIDREEEEVQEKRVIGEIRQSFPSVSESSLVGVEQSVEELVSYLVGENDVQVVSIYGMGGIGKTTLARQVFHCEMVRRHFNGFAWVFISQECRQKHVWRAILQSLKPKNEEQRILEMTVSGLQDELFILETETFFIVLDDLWSSAAWELIMPAFPHRSGSKILLTSRNEGVGLHPDLRCITFRPRFLTHEESWEVFQKIALFERNDTEFQVDDVKEEIQQMLKHCGGLPLAVKTLGGLLATKRTVSEWRKVHNNIGSHIAGDIGENGGNGSLLFSVLSLSYENLPSHLKQCFLYLAHFPEDHEIQTETLFNYWVSEGIVMVHSEESTIVDVAEDYLEELVKRNLVLVGKRNTVTSRIESCRLHDVVREVCWFKAKEDNFIQTFSAQNRISNATSALSSNRSQSRCTFG